MKVFKPTDKELWDKIDSTDFRLIKLPMFKPNWLFYSKYKRHWILSADKPKIGTLANGVEDWLLKSWCAGIEELSWMLPVPDDWRESLTERPK